LVFPLGNDEVWKSYIDRWIEYHQQDGSFDRVYQQWILGKEYRQDEPSWSVYSDVLGWDK